MTLNQLIYRATRPLGGLKVARFLSRNHPKILMYHRITEDPEGEGIPVEQFKRQVEIIKKHFNPLTLRELMTAHEEGRVPKHAVCVTFDDGYSDFSDIAFPILKEAGIPVTLFVTTGFVDGEIWLWPDQIRYELTNTNHSTIKLSWKLGALNLESDIYKVWSEIADYCLLVSNEDKLEIIEKLFNDLEVEKPESPPEMYRPVRWDEIINMVGYGLDLGSHSVSHPIMTKLDDDDLEKEMVESKKRLESNTGLPVNTFCYPNGKESDFDRRVKEKIRLYGYEYGVSAFPSRDPLHNKLSINRYPVGKSQCAFEKNIYGFSYLYMRY